MIQEELGEDINKVVVKENELASSLKKLKHSPALIIADNETISKIVDNIPESVKLTTYSLMMTRQQGNLSEFVNGIIRVKELKDGDMVLISEGCDNHLKEFGIGKLKIQEWLNRFTKKKLQIDFSNSCGYPDNLSDYNLIVHCDGCSISQKLFNSRIKQAKLLEIPIINYGVLTSFMNQTFPRTILPFNEIASTLNSAA